MLKQISVWLPNKPGVLSKFIDTLIEKNIEIRAVTVAENEDYGLLLLLVDKPSELYTLLEKSDYPVSITEVLAVKVNSDNNTRSLKKISNLLGENNINIEYLYSTLIKGETIIILRVDDNKKAQEVLREDGFLLEEKRAIKSHQL
ncbi:MAG: acetolactate synthase [Promethearchaeota archaeon]